MGKLIYATPCSLDGYIGRDEYDWSAPPTDVELKVITDVMRPIGTYLYGRKTFQTMEVWEHPEAMPPELMTPGGKDFTQVWLAADKIVYSRTLNSVSTKKTQLKKEFDPQEIRQLKSALNHDISVGGPELAGEMIRAKLVDEIHLFIVPVIKGGGVPVLPKDRNIKLELLEERRFGAGWIYLRYGTNP